MTINDDILALDQRRFKAMIAGDAGALEILLHHDLKYTHSSGAVDSKESYIRGVREKFWDYRSIETSNETVSVHGDMALVHCRLQIDLERNGVPRQIDSVALSVWVKDEGRWQILAVHSTPRPKG